MIELLSYLDRAAFNLLINATCSFLAGLLIVGVSLRLFKVDASRWKLFLLTLPFAKIVWDLLVRRIPPDSLVYSGLNPLNLPPKSQTLTIGAGFSEWGPIFNFVFTANDLQGKAHSASLADYIYWWLIRNGSAHLPVILLAVLITLSGVFLIRRIVIGYYFERTRRKTCHLSSQLETIVLGPRVVKVYCSDEFSGTPFTGGIFRPYICFPKSTWEALSLDERQAVLQHELAHIKHWDLPVTLLIKFLGDLFWFVPGYRWLSRKIDGLREILADQDAIRLGAKEAHLASALLRLKEIPSNEYQSILYSAFFRERSLLKERVERLIGSRKENKRPRLGWNWLFVKVLVAGWTTGGVMIATVGGNHEVKVEEFPAWIENILKSLGL